MSEKRKVDKLAGKGSFLDKLKARREAMDDGRPEDAPDAFKHAQDRSSEKKEELDTIREEQDKEERVTRKERRSKEYGD